MTQPNSFKPQTLTVEDKDRKPSTPVHVRVAQRLGAIADVARVTPKDLADAGVMRKHEAQTAESVALYGLDPSGLSGPQQAHAEWVREQMPANRPERQNPTV